MLRRQNLGLSENKNLQISTTEDLCANNFFQHRDIQAGVKQILVLHVKMGIQAAQQKVNEFIAHCDPHIP